MTGLLVAEYVHPRQHVNVPKVRIIRADVHHYTLEPWIGRVSACFVAYGGRPQSHFGLPQDRCEMQPAKVRIVGRSPFDNCERCSELAR